MRIFLFFTFFIVLLQADGVKPAYVEIVEKGEHRYGVLIKTVVEAKKKPSVELKNIKVCTVKSEATTQVLNTSHIKRYDLECTQTLKGQTIELEGLESQKTDLLLRLEFLDNSSQSALLNVANSTYMVEEAASRIQIVQTYAWLGITHILMGYDHLLFVFLLLLIVKNMPRLLWTISAFTLAHSLTMAGATLGLVSMPQGPVEAIIALSIVFLALEVVNEKKGKSSLTLQSPWIVAFIFGLLHGFGFAGALAEVGVPEEAITLALLFFNIGVELGQLIFVFAVVLVALLLQRFLAVKQMNLMTMVMVYAIGGLASFWMIERVLAF
ncbi:MAG: membrane protein, putative [uncultured Sulfurovum sp.]|uniref:Membrane protein, putative n=1 Tax=uncultured Sulfurovum sp. TaxID=269237 RepID=A0A6S6TZQ6_9BACT|nr:MAG: membrane protein, putative [uncultured Sulfurovum sp.]